MAFCSGLDMLYELSSKSVLLLLRVPVVSSALTWFSKVWLRHARIAGHLRAASYDGIIDGGANIGEFSGLARMVCPSTPLVCVEPHPPSAKTLRRRGFTVIEAALWRDNGRLVLNQVSEASTSCTVTSSGDGGRPSWEVTAVRLDALPVTGRNLFIKLDLQGAEPQALEGLGELWDRVGGLLLEVSYGAGGTYETLRTLLASRGFHEAATFNELEDHLQPVEADKLWLRGQ